MVNLKVVVQKTPVKIHRNSLPCRARISSATMNADGFGVYHLFKGRVIDPTTTKTPYPQIVKMYTDRRGNIPDNPKIFCWCGCAWFKYNCEVALAIRGSSAIISTNGALPKITNPTSRPQVCKHMLTFLKSCWRAKERIDTNKAQGSDQGLNRLEAVVNRKSKKANQQTQQQLNQIQHPDQESTGRPVPGQQQAKQKAQQQNKLGQKQQQGAPPQKPKGPVSGVTNSRTGQTTGVRPSAAPKAPAPQARPPQTAARSAGQAGQANKAGGAGGTANQQQANQQQNVQL